MLTGHYTGKRDLTEALSYPDASKGGDEDDKEDLDIDEMSEEQQMMRLLGFGNFDSTKVQKYWQG